jgi:hypothetical protein
MFKVKCQGLNKIESLYVVNGERNTSMTTKGFSEWSPKYRASDREVELDKLIK